MLYVYLDESIQDAEEFKTVKYTDRGTEHVSHFFGDISISKYNGSIKMHLDHGDPIPAILEPHVRRVYLCEYVSPKAMKDRLFGEYEYKTARAVVDDDAQKFKIEINGENLKDVRELYRLIRAGQIFPSVPWTEPQVRPVKLNIDHVAVVDVVKAYLVRKYPGYVIDELDFGTYEGGDSYIIKLVASYNETQLDGMEPVRVNLHINLGRDPHIEQMDVNGFDRFMDLHPTPERSFELLSPRT